MSTGEFELIERLCARLPAGRRTLLGPGDDAAILAPGRGRLLLTIDSMVEGVHFRLGWGTPELLGARALAVNLSDIAAMGGTPVACVVNLGIARGQERGALLSRLYAGLARAARADKVGVAGGNVTRARELTITIALLGELAGTALRRDSARAGDAIYVTGTLGDAAAGLRILQRRLTVRGAAREFLVRRCLAPRARLFAGQRLARMRPAPAAIDLSDGLIQDLGHILKRSSVGAELDAGALPLSPAYRRVMNGAPDAALGGGEDYELLFCMPPARSETWLARELGVKVTQVGRIVRGRGIRLSGAPAGLLRRAGFDQMRSGSR